MEGKNLNSSQDEKQAELIDKILDLVPEDRKNDAARNVIMLLKQEERFEGPIPHPEFFEKYENTLPGSAERILSMAERQQSHRIEMEKKVISEGLVKERRGQIFGFVLFILCLITSVVFIYFGLPKFGGILATISAIAVVGLFLGGKMVVRKNLKNNTKNLQ